MQRENRWGGLSNWYFKLALRLLDTHQAMTWLSCSIIELALIWKPVVGKIERSVSKRFLWDSRFFGKFFKTNPSLLRMKMGLKSSYLQNQHHVMPFLCIGQFVVGVKSCGDVSGRFSLSDISCDWPTNQIQMKALKVPLEFQCRKLMKSSPISWSVYDMFYDILWRFNDIFIWKMRLTQSVNSPGSRFGLIVVEPGDRGNGWFQTLFQKLKKAANEEFHLVTRFHLEYQLELQH